LSSSDDSFEALRWGFGFGGSAKKLSFVVFVLFKMRKRLIIAFLPTA
jgi:hypothetical protein